MSDHNEIVENASTWLLSAHREKAAYLSPAAHFGIEDIDAAYQVQDAFVEKMIADGMGTPVGYKIALTSAVMQEMCGVDHPLAGVVLSSRVFESPAELSLSNFQHMGMEFELAVYLARDLPPIGRDYTISDIADAVSHCVPAFELIEDRGADYSSLEGKGMIADNAWNGGVVLGQATGDWRALDFANTPVTLHYEGADAGPGNRGEADVMTSNTGVAMDHPFIAVAWIANHLNARGSMLKAQEFVMTGSTIKTQFPTGGEVARYEIDGLGKVEARVAPSV